MIVFYTTGCPKCKILKTKLDAKGISYEICEDTSVMESKGIEAVPVLELENHELLQFGEAIKWVNSL